MDFDAILNRNNQEESSHGNTNNNQPGEKYPDTKHEYLRHPKNGDRELYLQLLPNKASQDGNYTKNDFGVLMREVWVQDIPKRDGSTFSTVLKLSAEVNVGKDGKVFVNAKDRNTELETKLQEWISNGKNVGAFGDSKPTAKVLFNAVEVVEDGNGNLTQKKDSQGLPMVQVYAMPWSAAQSLTDALGKSRNNTSNTEASFLHPHAAKPVAISKASATQYKVEPTLHAENLPQLPQGWETVLEDVEAQGTPAEEMTPNWVSRVIAMKEGQPIGGNREGNQPQPNQVEQPAENPYAEAQAQSPMPEQPTQPEQPAPAPEPSQPNNQQPPTPTPQPEQSQQPSPTPSPQQNQPEQPQDIDELMKQFNISPNK